LTLNRITARVLFVTVDHHVPAAFAAFLAMCQEIGDTNIHSQLQDNLVKHFVDAQRKHCLVLFLSFIYLDFKPCILSLTTIICPNTDVYGHILVLPSIHILFANTNISTTNMYLNIFVLAKSNMGRREYLNIFVLYDM
jgi:hypothetical protein